MKKLAMLSAMTLALFIAFSVTTTSIVKAEDEDKLKVKLIVNNSVADESISMSDIKKIMLGTSKKWKNGDKIYIAILKEGPVHEAFTTTFTGKTESQFKSSWKKLAMTGQGVEPKAFKTEAELMAYVAKTKGAVGYVVPDSELKDVKELKVIKE